MFYESFQGLNFKLKKKVFDNKEEMRGEERGEQWRSSDAAKE